METRLNLYNGLIGMVLAACYCYGLYWVIEPMVARSESWITIFYDVRHRYSGDWPGFSPSCVLFWPLYRTGFFSPLKVFFAFFFWTIRRIRALSARPLP